MVCGGLAIAGPPHAAPLDTSSKKHSESRTEQLQDSESITEGRELASEVSVEEATEALKSLEDLNQILGQVNSDTRSGTGEQ